MKLRKDKVLLITYLFFLPIFIARIFIGGMGPYSGLPQIPLGWFGYLSNAVIIFLFLLEKTHDKKNINGLIWLAVLLVIIEVIQITLMNFQGVNIEHGEMFVFFGRTSLQLLSIYIFVVYYFNKEVFLYVFERLSLLTIYVSLVAFLAYYTVGSTVQLHMNYGYPRVQGLLSEPSALASMLAAFSVISLFNKKWLWLVLTVVCAAMSRSPLVYVAIFLSTSIAFYFIKIRELTDAKRASLNFFILVFAATLIILYAFDAPSYLEGVSIRLSESDSLVLEPVGRFVHLILVVTSSDLSSVSLGTAGVDRIWGFVTTFEELGGDGVLLSGYGLNGSNYIFNMRYGEIRDYGFLAFLLSSYGVIGAVIIIVAILLSLAKLIKRDLLLGLIGLSFFIGVAGNSAGGVPMYGLCVMMVFVQLYRVRLRIRVSRSVTFEPG